MKDKTFNQDDIDARTKKYGNIYPMENMGEPEKPLPLSSDLSPPNPFPVDTLGCELEKLINEVHRIIKAPVAVCAQSIMGAISLAVQPHADIFLDGRVSPLSLFFLTVAKSGERKSAVDNVALRPIDQFEQKKQEQYLAEFERYQDEKIQNASLSKKERVNLPKPREQTIIMTEPTFEGMIKLYDEGQPSMGLFSDEGGRFIYGHGMNDDNKIKTSTGISGLWDGKYISSVRAGSGTKKLYGRRLAFHLMLQPKIATSVFSDNSLIDQGFIGRCLISWPKTIMGERVYTKENIFDNPSYLIYSNKIASLLSYKRNFRENDSNSLNPRQITLTPQAFELFLAFYNEVEHDLQVNGQYAEISSFANKSPEHACRIAGCFAIYHDINATEISALYMDNAIKLVRYYLQETVRLLSNPELNLITASQREINNHALGLLNWLNSKYAEKKYFKDDIITLRDIRRSAPLKYRDKETCHQLIAQLIDAGWMTPIYNRKSYKLIFEQ